MINLVLILNIITILVCLPMNTLILIQFFKKIYSYNKKEKQRTNDNVTKIDLIKVLFFIFNITIHSFFIITINFLKKLYQN